MATATAAAASALSLSSASSGRVVRRRRSSLPADAAEGQRAEPRQSVKGILR